MLVAFGRRAVFVVLLFLISCVVGLRQYGTPSGTLYVADDHLEKDQKYTIINQFFNEEPNTNLERRKRDVTPPPTPGAQKNISTWTTHLNDSHQQLMVHWVGEGSNVIICLARDSVPRAKGGISPSALYISYNYGMNFTNKTESFRLGDSPDSGYAQLDKFFNHPKYPQFCVFVDSTNKKLFYTSDNGVTIHRSDLNFHPNELAFDEEFPSKYVVLDKVGSNRMLYLTLDGGKSFKLIQNYVKTFYWSSGPGFSKVFYVERWKPDRNSTVISANDPTELNDANNVVFLEARDFQIKGDYMFATRQTKEKNTLSLYISHQRGPFYKAEFQTELDLRKFHIADVTDKRIFVSVMHTDNLAHLYVSEINNNFTQYNFVLSLEQVLCYFPDGNWKDSWLEDVTEDPFTDLYRVEGLKGVYIASRVHTKTLVGTVGPEHLISLITYDHGVTWSPINPPTEDENGKPLNCQIENSCSLHLCQKFSQLYPVTRSASIMSSKSAPGIIMATGVLGKSLKGIPGVYISRDAGLSWKRILKDYYFFNYGDHGGVLVAVKYFKSRGETRRILYSTNEGIDWHSYQFNDNDLRIYGLMTEPGENTTTFTMFGSANDQHQWIIITIDLRNTFERNCTADDYKFWSPSSLNSLVSCVLGVRETFQRRIPNSNCYNGIDYDRPVKKEICECSRRDFECDFGFMRSGVECVRNKSVVYDPYAIPAGCRPGQSYMRTKGYRKIDGDVCVSPAYMPYAPDKVACPITEPTEFLIVALRDKVARIDLSDNSTLTLVSDQKNIVAIEIDMKNNCLYWADIDSDKIKRQCFNNGTPEEIIVGSDLASIEGMALDWISNVLFFVDGRRNKIEAVRTDLNNEGRMRVTILDSKVLSKPRGIAVHPRAGYLFWTDWDRSNPSVSRSNLDGSDIKRLFKKPTVHWPNGITIDQMSERIYWVDAMEDYIASADLDGRHFKRILWNDERVAHPFAIAVLKDKMYWDDWKAKSIFYADKHTGLDIVTINNSFTGLMDLKVFAHFVQQGSNACSNNSNACHALCLGGPANTFSCLCPDGLTRTTEGKCMCPNNEQPTVNMTCPSKPGATCGKDQFTCKSGACIEASWRCDGNNDCGDMSDEIGCQCTPPMIACDDTRCYLPHWKCDGDFDCKDMSDEKDCDHHNCTENQFQCANGLCIEKRWVCDGDNDCKDGSDERNCSAVQVKRIETGSGAEAGECAADAFRCSRSSAACIPAAWACDGERDCPGGEDELPDSCRNASCAPYMYRCPSGKCIFRSWLCDGENDCSDTEASDEKNCTGNHHSKLLPRLTTEKIDFASNTSCLDWMFRCNNGNCLPYWWRCDGVDDCNDFSDEIGCGSTDTTVIPSDQHPSIKCGKNQFTCSPGVCIPLTWVCDSMADCVDGADEQPSSCERRAGAGAGAEATSCSAHEAPCADGRGCVRDDQLCDGVPQCEDRSDELHCEPVAKQPAAACPSGTQACDGGARCVARSALCDGRADCRDGSDELDCPPDRLPPPAYQFLSLGVDQSTINSTSFLISCWMAQQKLVKYSFLPSISKVEDGVWRNMTWTNDSIYRFTNLEPYTNYNVTFYIQDSKSNRTYASLKYVNMTTGEGVPSPPRRVSVSQLVGRRVNVRWDAPLEPRGRLHHYTLYYAPPLPPMQHDISPDDLTINVKGFFKPNITYSFWMTATNGASTSPSSTVMNITFEEPGDVDELANVSVARPSPDRAELHWHHIRAVDGYQLQVRLPAPYARRPPIVTKDDHATVTNLPPGVDLFIDIRAFKNNIYGDPFTIPLRTTGEPDETLNLTAMLLKEKGTSVQLTWSPPLGDRYKNKTLEYEVHYIKAMQRRMPGGLSNDTKIVTKNNTVTVEGLESCESYVFAVGLLGGPLSKFVEIVTRGDPKAPVKNLHASYNKLTSELYIFWFANCDVLREPVPYRLEIKDEVLDKTSYYELKPKSQINVHHVIENVPVGGKYNICVSAGQSAGASGGFTGTTPRATSGAVWSGAACTVGRCGAIPAPRALLALLTDGHLMVSWKDDAPPSDAPLPKYQVIISEKEIPDDLVQPSEDMKSVFTDQSPLIVPAPSNGPLYVSVRAVAADGRQSDLSEIRTIAVDGLERPGSSAVSAVWWAGAAGGALALVALLLAARAARGRWRRAGPHAPHAPHTPRYDSRRGQATLGDHDDDDVPPIQGFSDDEPLVIA